MAKFDYLLYYIFKKLIKNKNLKLPGNWHRICSLNLAEFVKGTGVSSRSDGLTGLKMV